MASLPTRPVALSNLPGSRVLDSSIILDVYCKESFWFFEAEIVAWSKVLSILSLSLTDVSSLTLVFFGLCLLMIVPMGIMGWLIDFDLPVN